MSHMEYFNVDFLLSYWCLHLCRSVGHISQCLILSAWTLLDVIFVYASNSSSHYLVVPFCGDCPHSYFIIPQPLSFWISKEPLLSYPGRFESQNSQPLHQAYGRKSSDTTAHSLLLFDTTPIKSLEDRYHTYVDYTLEQYVSNLFPAR